MGAELQFVGSPSWALVLTSDEAVVKVLGCAFSRSHPKFFFFDISSQGLRMTSRQTFVGSLTFFQFVLCHSAGECFGICFL